MRAVWFLAGGAAGVYATSRARRVAEALSYDGVHDRLTGWFAGARVLRDEVRAGIAEKQTELQERLAIGGGATVLALRSSDTRPDDATTDESRGNH